MSDKKDFTLIERRMLVGMIISTDFMAKIIPILKTEYIQSSSAKLLMDWVLEYYRKYGKAPGQDIEPIFYKKAKKLNKETVQDLEEVMEDLSSEYEETELNFDALSDDVQEYLNTRSLQIYLENLQILLDKGEIEKARDYQAQYQPIIVGDTDTTDFTKKETVEVVKSAMTKARTPLFTLPKQLGTFINHQLIPGGFIAFLAPEKRGKSWILMNLITEALRQDVDCALFQAGDMTTEQQVRRFIIRLAKKSDQEVYCSEHYQPIRDCVHNQRDTCDKQVRECSFGPFSTLSAKQIREEVTKQQLIEALKEYPDYKPCWNCSQYQTSQYGAVWLEKVSAVHPITETEAVKTFEKFFQKQKRNLRISTHPSGTLTISKVLNLLQKWDKEEGFRPRFIAFDYIDIMAADKAMEFRHQENEKWKGLRRISQLPWEPLVGTVTQADADSYGRNMLSLKNFSEDKRKYAHVTAFYGLNQDPEGREKALGIMRLNELLIREGEPNEHRQVYLLQNLRRGLAFRQSFF